MTEIRASILAFEVAARYESGGRLHSELHRLLTEHPAQATSQEKWSFYRAVASELVIGLPSVVAGCWDFFDDDQRARKDFEQWVTGMTTEEGARTTPSGEDAYRGDPRYMTFTMAFLLLQGSQCEAQVSAACTIPEDVLWHRSSFARILKGMSALNFGAVLGDVAYLIPRDPGWGLTAQDLAEAKFGYLRTLVG